MNHHRSTWGPALGLLLAAVVFHDPAIADCVDYQDYLHWAGSMDTPGSALAIATQGSFAFVADSDLGLQVIDISNPGSPVIVGHIDTPGYAMGVAVSESYAYVGDGLDGLFVVDISNPASPAIAGSIDTPEFANDVAVSGSYAYVCDGLGGLLVIDVSNAASPEIVGGIDTPQYAAGVAVSGSYAYVCDVLGGLLVIDVSNVASPAIVGSFDTQGATQDVAISDTYAYVADASGGLLVIDVSNPALPAIVSTLLTRLAAHSVVLSGSYAFLAESKYSEEDKVHFGGGDLEIIDVAHPESSVSLGIVSTLYDANDVVVVGDHAYVTERVAGVQVIDISHPTSPFEGSVDTPDIALDVAVSEPYAFVADFTSVQALDVSNPASPVIVGAIDTPGYTRDIAVCGSFAYVADYSFAPDSTVGFQVIDISNPASMTIVAHLDTPGDAFGVAVSGSFAYVASNGLQVIDISDPALPVLVGGLSQPSSRAIAVAGNRAYLLRNDGLAIIDISSPASPALLRFFPTTAEPARIAVSGSLAYMTTTGNGLQVIDVTDPASPLVLGSAGIPNCSDVTISGSYAYVTVGEYGCVQVIDVTNPEAPEAMGIAETPDGPAGIAASGSSVFVAALWAGLSILPTQCSSPTDVQLSFFQASSKPGGILLEWATSLESDFSGFYVRRSLTPEGGYERINPRIIAPPSPYRFLDSAVSSGVTYYYRLEALDRSGARSFFGPISRMTQPLGLVPRLDQSRPNPFTGNGTTIPFALPRSGEVRLSILDLSGRLVRHLVAQRMEGGEKEISWDGRDDRGVPVPAGLYFYRLEAPGFEATKRLVRLD